AESPAGTSEATRTTAASRRILFVSIGSGSFRAGPMPGRHVQPPLLPPPLRRLAQRSLEVTVERRQPLQPPLHPRVLRRRRVLRRLQQLPQVHELPAPLLHDPVVQLLVHEVVVPPV